MTNPTSDFPLELLVDGVDFGESPRWHDDTWWYSDFFQRAIYRVSTDGTRVAAYSDLDDRPSGIGWMPDGTLLVVFMTSQRVMRDDGHGNLVEHADLSSIATGYCNDMVVDAAGNAYVGNFGFDLEARHKFQRADLALVRSNGAVEVAAEQLKFPNGSVITASGTELIVGQTFGSNYLTFRIRDDATLEPGVEWAAIEGTAPDGCTLDELGGIWFADANHPEVIRVETGGLVTHRIATPMPVFACMLGGPDGRDLTVVCAPGSQPDEAAGKAAGAIYTTRAPYPRDGRP